MSMRIDHELCAEVDGTHLTLDEMSELISKAINLDFKGLDRIQVQYHKADSTGPREHDCMTLNVRKAPGQ